ncbi:MAG: hypothetical protein FWF69_09995 [Firmicutes bacterium]|nr:hypothetical protein [Bacillota bacterium]
MKKTPCTCFALILLIFFALSGAASPAIIPLEEMDTGSMLYELYLEELDISLMLPLSVSSEVMVENAKMKAYRLMPRGFEKTYFVLFTLPAEHLTGQSLSTMDDDGMREVISVISNEAGMAKYDLIENYYGDVDVLHVVERRDGVYSEHLVVLYDGVVLNVMLERMDGSDSLSSEELAQQHAFLMMALCQEGNPKHYKRFALPDTDIVMDLPEGMSVLAAEELENTKYITIQTPSDFGGAFIFIAERSDEYLGETIETLPEALLTEAISRSILFAPIDESFRIDRTTATGIPILCFESKFQDDCPIKHRIALKDEYALTLYFLPYKRTYDAAWIERWQSALMRRLLTGQGEVPVGSPFSTQVVNGKLMIPLDDRFLVFELPEDCFADISEDAESVHKVYIVPNEGVNKIVLIESMYTGGSMVLSSMSADVIKSVAEMAGGAMKSVYKNEFVYEMREKWVLSLPTLCIEDVKGIVGQYHLNVGNYYVIVSYFSQDGTPFPSEQISDYIGRFSLVPMYDDTE